MTARRLDTARRRPSLGRRVTTATDRVFHGIARGGHLAPFARPSTHGVRVDRDIPYLGSDHPRQRLDIYHPPRARERIARGERLPVVVYAHGGAFRLCSKQTHWMMALSYARRGYLVFNVSYRIAHHHTFPSQLEDVCSAYSWVVANAERHGGDLSRLVVAGESAGGNLITALTIAACYPRGEPFAQQVWETGVVPRATVPACALLQTSHPERFRERWPDIHPLVYSTMRNVCESYLGANTSSDDPSLELANPLLFLERGEAPSRSLPSFFIPCGTRDPMVDDSQRLDRALAALGVDHELELYPGQVHVFHVTIYPGPARRCWEDTFAFLDRRLGG